MKKHGLCFNNNIGRLTALTVIITIVIIEVVTGEKANTDQHHVLNVGHGIYSILDASGPVGSYMDSGYGSSNQFNSVGIGSGNSGGDNKVGSSGAP